MAARYDWEAIEAEYRTGRFSLRQLSDRHGPSEAAIRKRAKGDAKRPPWKKDLTDAVRKRTREKITREALPPEARDALNDDDEAIVEHAATENSAVVHGHRKILGRWRFITEQYAELLETQLATGKIDVQVKSGDVVPIDVPLDYVGKAMANGTAAMEKVVKLERQSYGLDLEGEDTPPEREMTDAELDAKIRRLQDSDG
jgi:hypothetical protein